MGSQTQVEEGKRLFLEGCLFQFVIIDIDSATVLLSTTPIALAQLHITDPTSLLTRAEEH